MILLMPLLKKNALHMDQLILMLKNTEKILVQTNSSNQTRFVVSIIRTVLIKKTLQTELLMNRWRFPTLSLHGIEGAYADQGGKTVIPRQVIGKFSLRIVPSQTPEQIEKCVTDYIMKLHAESGSANEIKVEMPNGGKPWVADINDPNFQAGRLGPFSN